MTVTVTIAEDDLLVRQGLTAIIASFDDIELAAACVDFDSLMASLESSVPDVVLTDIRMPPGQSDEGIRAANSLRTTNPDVGVIVLSQYDSPAYALALLEGGSSRRGYLLKERVSDPEYLLSSIQSVAQGGSVIDAAVVDILMARRSQKSPLRFLTPREVEVLSQMAQGKDNRSIADALFISLRAVEKHNNSIFSKLGLTTLGGVDKRVQAVLRFLDDQS